MSENKTLMVLVGMVIFFTLIVLLVVYVRPDDGQLYTLFGGAFSGFVGALMMHLRGGKSDETKKEGKDD